jgi:hypothetical protein
MWVFSRDGSRKINGLWLSAVVVRTRGRGAEGWSACVDRWQWFRGSSFSEQSDLTWTCRLAFELEDGWTRDGEKLRGRSAHDRHEAVSCCQQQASHYRHAPIGRSAQQSEAGKVQQSGEVHTPRGRKKSQGFLLSFLLPRRIAAIASLGTASAGIATLRQQQQHDGISDFHPDFSRLRVVTDRL